MSKRRKLTPEEKASRARQRMIEKSREWTIGTHTCKVAAVYQQMVRAEAAAMPEGMTSAVVGGQIAQVFRRIGQCVCVTCGKVGFWKGNTIGGGTIETGHFVASRRASILFEPTNAHPQCKHCNRHLGGNQANYELWMQHTYGPSESDRLRRLKRESRQFTREELVDRKIDYQARLNAATDAMVEWMGVK